MREVRLQQLLMLWSLISMTEPKIAALDAAKIWQLFNLGGTVLVSAEHDGKTDMMPASWASPLDYDKVLLVVDKSHYTRKLIEKSGFFALMIPTAAIAPIVMNLGTVSKNDNPRKLEECGTRLVTLPEYDMPLLEGCAAWIVFRVVPELHNQEAYDLFIGEAVAAFADDRVFVNGRWNFEEAPDDLRTLHYVAGGHFYTIGDALEVPASA